MSIKILLKSKKFLPAKTRHTMINERLNANHDFLILLKTNIPANIY